MTRIIGESRRTIAQYRYAWAELLKGALHAFHAFLPLAASVPMLSGQAMAGLALA
jgi:hypothetical protein